MAETQSSYKILIVEDEDVLRDAYVNVFTIEKFVVDSAANGKIALEKLNDYQPNIIILDIMMPVMTGIEFLEQVNIAERFPNTRVLVLSNLSDKDTITRVTKLGAAQHLIKASVSPGQLVANVRQLLI